MPQQKVSCAANLEELYGWRDHTFGEEAAEDYIGKTKCRRKLHARNEDRLRLRSGCITFRIRSMIRLSLSGCSIFGFGGIGKGEMEASVLKEKALDCSSSLSSSPSSVRGPINCDGLFMMRLTREGPKNSS